MVEEESIATSQPAVNVARCVVTQVELFGDVGIREDKDQVNADYVHAVKVHVPPDLGKELSAKKDDKGRVWEVDKGKKEARVHLRGNGEEEDIAKDRGRPKVRDHKLACVLTHKPKSRARGADKEKAV